ncbi:MAG: sodium:solute symporter [Limisphaerales bacterium]
MNYFNTADWAVTIIYLVGIVLFGLWFGRGLKNTKDYFLGSKNIPWWGVGLSIVATETSALTFIGVPAMAYGVHNLAFIQIVIGYVIARIILAIIMVPLYFKGEIYSPYQLVENAFGAPARRTAAGFFLIAATIAAGVRVYVTCIPLRLMLGFEHNQIIYAILIFVLLSLAYTYVGGVKAVIWTDAVQFFLFVAGGLFTLFYIPSLLEGGFGHAISQADAAGKLQWFNGDFSLSMPFNIWMGVIGATFMVMSTHGADQLIVQRVLTCKSVTDGRKALLFSAILILPMFLLFLLVGAMLWVYYTQFPDAAVQGAKPDEVFPLFIMTKIPHVLKGFLIVAILSAAMSSVSSALSALASVSTMDFYKAMSKKVRSEEFYFALSKHSTAAWGIVLIGVAFLTQFLEQGILNAALGLNGLTNGAMLGALLLVLFWRKGSPWPVVTGMLLSLVCMIIIYHYVKLIAWPWYTLIGCTITISVAVVLQQAINFQAANRPKK